MYVEFTKEYREAIDEYEHMFHEEFLAFVYDSEEGIKVIAEAIASGKPHDWDNDPNFDQEAVY